jgi:predicted ATP-grasp superfamily ATP-dependent carboligase
VNLNAPTLVVAGQSARLMAETAARDGYRVIAMDAFGDIDTRRASLLWVPIATPGSLQIDPALVLGALREVAGTRGVIGWIAGADLEAHPELLIEGASLLPLIGTPAEAVERLREPAEFFATLISLELPHPDTRLARPADTEGWLRKHARAAGGWHIRRASDEDLEPDEARWRPYYQRETAGAPMSALALTNGQATEVVGFNELTVRPRGTHPHVFGGALGPVTLNPTLRSALADACDRLAKAFGLRGLFSLDFLLDGDRYFVLEINPRPTASLALYAPHLPLIRAHVEASLGGELMRCPQEAPTTVHGTEIVYARADGVVSARASGWLAGQPDTHDLPVPGAPLSAGSPLCSLSARGPDAAAVRATLARRREAVLHALKAMS